MIKTPTGIDDEEYHIQGFYPAAPYASNNFFFYLDHIHFIEIVFL